MLSYIMKYIRKYHSITVDKNMLDSMTMPREEVVTKLAKPKMRGLLAAQIKRKIITGSILSLACGYAYKVWVADVRKARYQEFYRNYNAEEVFEDIRKKGHFQSC